MSESMEYTIFTVTNKEGKEVELAVIDEFTFDGKNYVAGALVEGDEINMDGVYIYKVKDTKDGVTFAKITNSVEYRNVTEAYLEMSEEDGEIEEEEE